jgi:hypothetical protein
MKRIALIAAVALTGCATQDYQLYAKAQADIATAQSKADIARYQALADIAKQGDTAAKIAAVMTLQNNGPQTKQPQQVNAPRSPADIAFQWASLIVPTASTLVSNVYTVRSQTNLGITQSNNATALGVAQSTNAMTTATNTANAFVATATAGFNANTAIAGKIQAPQPNITLSGTGVIGNGTYTQTTMSGTGVLGTGTYTTDNRPTDNHSTSTTSSTSTSSSLTCTTGPC